ncbi:MAG: DUF92 domain-containing protein [Chloroflexi bacterium]|nr:DUF92 domain-containing protein [Chloroflexota bacterium]
MRPILRGLAGLGLGAAIALAGWRRGVLSDDGAAAATLVGTATFGAGGLAPAFGTIALFVAGSALSRRASVPGEVVAAKGHRRDGLQVLANGGVAAAGCLLAATGFPSGAGAALGALAAASADTWASEIGVRSPAPPRLITTGESVQPGVSGGVTSLGWLAGAAGALLVGGIYAIDGNVRSLGRRRIGMSRPLALALVAGLLGSLADSLAGATLQASYRCWLCETPAEAPTDHCGRPVHLVRGYAWITNDVVNVIATATGGLAGALLWHARNETPALGSSA